MASIPSLHLGTFLSVELLNQYVRENGEKMLTPGDGPARSLGVGDFRERDRQVSLNVAQKGIRLQTGSIQITHSSS